MQEEELQSPEETPKKRPLSEQFWRSIVFIAIAAAPAGLWFSKVGGTQPLVVLGLCVFIGFALSLPGVSGIRVAQGTVGMIVAHNAPTSMQGKVLDTFMDDAEETEDEQPQDEE